MDEKSIGKRITQLRKKSGMTQLALAQKLDISDRTVSKWENGQGYPDITVFPKLAALFGVTIDYLMLGEKKGIAIVGNVLTDIVKNIDAYPEQGMLTYVRDTTYAVGGCVPNTGINLAKIDGTIPISAIGKIGSDEKGRFVVSQLQQHGIDTKGIIVSADSETAYTDVMSMPSGERTFFFTKGATATFSPDEIDLDSLNCSMLHAGYILLLDMFDADDPEYGTAMARFLHKVQQKGIKTSIDVVSDYTADYNKKVVPALKYTNYAIMNEIESCNIWNLEVKNPDGSLNKANIKEAMSRMIDAGVKDKVIIHCKETSFVMNAEDKSFTEVPSLKIPESEIKGSVGAGDAFCAGSLYGIYRQFSDRQLLEFASAAAACNLFAANSVDGMKSGSEVLQMEEKYGRWPL